MGYISLTIVAFLVAFASPVVLATDTAPIPEDRSQIPQWFQTNVAPYSQRKGTLDPALEAAETARQIITVSYNIVRYSGLVFNKFNKHN